MRIIAGTAKGARLGRVPPGTRPVSDRAREGLFASLGTRVEGARVLDLFAGTGALGIEAASRGAAAVTFVDGSRRAVAAVRANLEHVRIEAVTEVTAAEVRTFLRTPPSPEQAFDLVFCDPPYDAAIATLEACLAGLADGWLAGGDWIVVVTRGHKGPQPGLPLHWAPWRQLRYGDSLLTLYREVGWA